jgi:hypothetical protein
MWSVGDRVLAHRPPGDFWYPGVVRHIQDERFFIIYDDGEDGFVKAKQMMPLAFEVGDRVFARVPPGREYDAAKVIDKQQDQLQVEFADGSLAWASPAAVRVQPSAWKRPAARSGPAEWKVGDRVLACWFDLLWYSGAVLAVDGDTVNVVFDHGGFAAVPHDRVRAVELEEGDRVQGRWKAGADFYPGKVVRRDGEVVEVLYDDGDEETTLVRLLRLERDDWLPEPDHPDLGPGDRVLGCWYDGFWYPGVILTLEGKRLHVLFDDNDQAFLTWDKLRPLSVGVGDRVYCRWKGGPFYYAAEVVRQQGERLFVEYEDGREEWTSVRLIRVEGERGE